MIIYWNAQKIPLTPQEVDGNFEYLETELQDAKTQLCELRKQVQLLEAQKRPPQETLTLSYQNRTLSLSAGEYTATASLPIWSFKGPWSDTASYDVGDLVVYEGRIYYCNTATQACPLEASWEELPFQNASATTMLSASPIVN